MFSNSYAPINNYFNISFFIFFLLVALCIVCQIAAKGRLPITFSLVFAKTSNLPNIVLRVFYFLIFLCTLISMYLAFLSASADDKADPYSMTLVLFLVFFLSLTRILFGKNREQFQEIQTDSDPRHIETTANPLNDEKQKEEQSSSDTTRDFTDENSNSDQTTSKTSVSSFKTDCDLENNFSASSNIKKTNSGNFF
ncbi:transmembrane protein [Anaeramoeba flamelloides]|uniref:Transmembrane protein n=1 Tax=Anaeramoeba flamelloides TaxID=1746091 RepID=A0ABQ8Z3V7_9EUKA|nr:transmembrane protein [Anaeramoeba flamelloides]